jgi:rRNA maturation endonuclease Nob1
MYLTGDALSPDDLLDYHEFRKKFPYLYICKKCARGFDADRPTKECKFCGGEVKEVEKDDRLSSKTMYTYVCPMCYKEFVAEEAEECPKCGGRFLHKYKTVRIGTRQLISMRKDQIKNKLKKAVSNAKKLSKGDAKKKAG